MIVGAEPHLDHVEDPLGDLTLMYRDLVAFSIHVIAAILLFRVATIKLDLAVIRFNYSMMKGIHR